MATLVLRDGALILREGGLAIADDPCKCCEPTEPPEPCGTQATSGGVGVTVNRYAMPNKEGEVQFTYDSYDVPDAYKVEGGGRVFIDTGPISGSRTLTFCKPKGVRSVTVTVTGPIGTVWNYQIGCPDNPCSGARADYPLSGSGPGTILKTLIRRYLGIQATPDCLCSKRALIMDGWGPAVCRENLDTIVGWLREEAENRGLPFLDVVGRQLVLLAISRAEELAEQSGITRT